MTRPTVSVIVPAYNAEATLARAIDSVLAQTFDDWELIVVDDGSTDATEAVARSYEPRVTVLRRPHLGPGPARNAGVQASRGAWLAWLDADDVWYPTKLERQISVARQDAEIEFVTANYRYIDADGHDLGTGFARVGWLCERIARQAANGTLIFDRSDVPQFLREGFGATITMMLSRSLFDRVGGFCDWLTVAEDVHLALRAVAGCTKFAAVCEPLATYHLHDDSTTRGNVESAHGQTVLAYRDLRRLLETCGEPIRQALAEPLSRAYLNQAKVLGRLGRRREGLKAAWRSLRLRPRRMAFSMMYSLAFGG